MDIWGWILLICSACLAILWFLSPAWEPEAFQNPPNLPWIVNALDKDARAGNTCNVLERFPDTELVGAVVEIMDASCESGLPHTVGLNQIRIPISAWTTDERRASILRHERIHLQQRRNPEIWRDFYKQAWMYTTHQEEEVPEELRSEEMRNIRGNPDTWPERWACWKNRYWFLPAYTNPAEPKLPQATVKIWDSQQKNMIDSPPIEWRMLFCDERGKCPYQHEHPAEMSAEYATDLSEWTSVAAMSLRGFLEQNYSQP